MERITPCTVSPGAKRLAFSIHVPSSSRWVRVTRRVSRSMDKTAARIFCPTRSRAAGWGMRETEMRSMGSMATIPQPMSTNAPKGSICVTRQVSSIPGSSTPSRYSIACSCAARRDSSARGAPLASASSRATVKQTGFPTSDRRAMSRSAPLIHGATASSRGIRPSMGPRLMWSVPALSHRSAGASRILFCSSASRRRAGVNGTQGRSPSGRKALFSGMATLSIRRAARHKIQHLDHYMRFSAED